MLPTVTWENLDWSALERLRGTFLDDLPPGESYWRSLSDLANYDFTYAQRIGWKWGAVLDELKRRGWAPPAGPLLDWGCGSGIAGRYALEAFGVGHFTKLSLFDRSRLAVEFATARAKARFPSAHVKPWIPDDGTPIGTLLVSHVLNELSATERDALLETAARADAILWVEPGTHADSRSLIAVREALCGRFQVISPCTHQSPCGLLTLENERHWCHFFTGPPPGVLGDSNWVRFGNRAGIDLRRVPYSCLVLERAGLRSPVPGLLPEGSARVIGQPRLYKGFVRIFSCQADGVRDFEAQKRDCPELFKAVRKETAAGCYRWRLEGERIKEAERLA